MGIGSFWTVVRKFSVACQLGQVHIPQGEHFIVRDVSWYRGQEYAITTVRGMVVAIPVELIPANCK